MAIHPAAAPPSPAAVEALDWHLDDPSDARTTWEAQELAADVDFLPVPVRPRADGWTAAKQAAFIGWLGDLGSVDEAAAMVGMSNAGAYKLRQRAGAESFAAAWDRTLLWAGESLMERSIRRAVTGVAIPVIRGGRVIGARRVHDDGLLIKLMKQVDRRTLRRQRRAGVTP